MRLLSASSTLDQVLIKQITPLRRQLTALFEKFAIDESRQTIFRQQMEAAFMHSFARPIPATLEQRAIYERALVHSIQQQLQQDQLILRRTADQHNTFYLGSANAFQRKTMEYISNSHWLELVTSIGALHTEQQQIDEIVRSINGGLCRLELIDLISMDHRRRFQIHDRTTLKLPRLDFLPEDELDGEMSVKARLSSHRHTPIYALASFLDRLLRPLFDKYSQSTRLTSGADFIQKITSYTSQTGCLTPSTRFITFRIHNCSTRPIHANLLNVVSQFLAHQIGAGDHQRLSATAIVALIGLVLSNNQFMHDGIVYRFIRGGPANLALTQLLADIYLQDWQRALVRQIRLNQGFYGRYHETGILTWNGTADSFAACILELNEQYPDLQLTTSSGLQVHFLDCHIENQNGHLHTRVHHDPRKQLFLLPYTADHPRLLHRQWFRFALARAGQYCVNYDDFEEERLRIELTFLANGYSLDFVDYHLQQFFDRFYPRHSLVDIDRSTYASFRSRLFHYVSEHQYEREAQSADPRTRFIRLHYVFDWGARREFNQTFQHLWSTLIQEDPALQKEALEMVLHTKHGYLSNALFAHGNSNA